MMFKWQPEMVRFMRDASEYSTYNDELAGLICPYVDRNTHICDAGCGLGYLSLALSDHVGQITAVDVNSDALKVLKENINGRNIKNISVKCGYISENCPETKYDAMVFCFFGGMKDVLAIAKTQCSGDVFIVCKNYNYHWFSAGTHAWEDHSLEAAFACLDGLSVPYESREIELEFGQPFRSLADARLFFKTYSMDEDKSVLTDEFILSRVIKTGKADFPFYMPHLRRIGFIRLNAKDIPGQEK